MESFPKKVITVSRFEKLLMVYNLTFFKDYECLIQTYLEIIYNVLSGQLPKSLVIFSRLSDLLTLTACQLVVGNFMLRSLEISYIVRLSFMCSFLSFFVLDYIIKGVPFECKWYSNRSIWPIDGTLTGLPLRVGVDRGIMAIK